jgi:hypothetical protein
MPTPDEIRARVSVLMRTFQNAGAGPAGWKALARWTLEREGAAAGSRTAAAKALHLLDTCGIAGGGIDRVQNLLRDALAEEAG